jgi:hypothetical protein
MEQNWNAGNKAGVVDRQSPQNERSNAGGRNHPGTAPEKH